MATVPSLSRTWDAETMDAGSMFSSLTQAGWGMLPCLSLCGFFDDALLHQILPRHNLFSLAPGMAVLRLQVH